MGGDHLWADDPPPKKKEPRVGRGVFSVNLQIIQFKFQFPKSIKSQFNLSFEKKNLFPEMPKK